MAVWQKVVRAAALILLLIAATDVLFVDTAFAAACSANQTSSSTSTSNPGPGDDDCYCCCTHIVLTTGPKLIFTEILESVALDRVPPIPITDPKPILHPPKI